MIKRYPMSQLYDPGHEASLDGSSIIFREACLSMEEMEPEHGQGTLWDIPYEISLLLDIQYDFFTSDFSIERVINGVSAGVTPAYLPGHVLRDGSENLKPFSKMKSMNFVYQGCGFYWDVDDMRRPFYEGHDITSRILLKKGAVIFRKKFAGLSGSFKLETRFQKKERDAWTEALGFGRETYPLYPYGGYAPPQGLLTDMEQVYCLAAVDVSDPAHPVTALKLYRGSFFHQSGGFPPETFSYDQKTWVFPKKTSAEESLTVGTALCAGHLTFSVRTHEEEDVTYASYAYEQMGGSLTRILVHCGLARR